MTDELNELRRAALRLLDEMRLPTPGTRAGEAYDYLLHLCQEYEPTEEEQGLIPLPKEYNEP